MTETWGDFKTRLVHVLDGKHPFNDTEEHQVRDAWLKAPAHVEAEADKVAKLFKANKIYVPWKYLATVCHSSLEKWGVGDGLQPDGLQEESAARRQIGVWMRNVGIHFDRWTEVEDDLFGEHGQYRAFRNHASMVGDIMDLWMRLRAEQESAALSSSESPTVSQSPPPQVLQPQAAPQ